MIATRSARRALGVAALWGALLSCSAPPPPPTYTVVRGDTLFVIARDHGVTVDALRQWNGIEGDLIEVGQVLVVGAPGAQGAAPAAPPVPTARQVRTTSPSPSSSSPSSSLPPAPRPERCLAGPSPDAALGEEAVLAAQGLSQGQVRAALDPLLPYLAPCAGGLAGSLLTRLEVGCDGLVREVRILDEGPFGGEAIRCVVEVLRRGDFPAHDMPDGVSLDYPIRFGR